MKRFELFSKKLNHVVKSLIHNLSKLINSFPWRLFIDYQVNLIASRVLTKHLRQIVSVRLTSDAC